MGKLLFVEMVPERLHLGSLILKELSKLYCDTWRYDENFQEYRQCPICKKYFSYEQVEKSGIGTCNTGHRLVNLVEAWEPDKVSLQIREDMHLPGFSGFFALNEFGHVIGFSWAWLMSLSDIKASWGDDIVSLLKNPSKQVLYYSELGVRKDFRRMGYGSALVYKVLEKSISENPPEMTTLLRTHCNSRARKVFEDAGYRIFADDTMYGCGRVMMTTHIRDLTLSRLDANL